MPEPTRTLLQATEYVLDIRRLWLAGVVVRDGALFRIAKIHDDSTHPRLRRLCVRIAEEISGISLAPREVANG